MSDERFEFEAVPRNEALPIEPGIFTVAYPPHYAWRTCHVSTGSLVISSVSQAVFAQNPLPMFIFDATSLELLDVNAAVVEESGLSRHDLLAMSIGDFGCTGPFDVAAGCMASVSRWRAWRTQQDFEVRISLLHDTVPSIGLGVCWNVTQRNSSEALLREVNEQLVLSGLREQSALDDAERANVAKDEFLAVISHELRTPLQAMLGWIELLRSDVLSAADTAHALEVIDRNTRIQAQLVGDLLDVSRATTGVLRFDFVPLDLALLVETAVEAVRVQGVKKGVRLQFERIDRAIVIDGDRMRLEQVVTNLLVNALKFTPEGGSVHVALDPDPPVARLRVTDDGKGFDPKFAPDLFKPFRQEDSTSTRAQGGLGLGLMIVQHLVAAHRGRVLASSDGKGRGATFVVELPLSAHTTLAPAGDSAPPELAFAKGEVARPLAGLRALILEDHADSRELIGLVLQRSGADVCDAGSAQEALALLSCTNVDIVVTDLGMPDVDGYAFLRELRRAGGPARDIPVISLSAFTGPDNMARSLAAGFCAHAAKPIEPAELIKLVASAAGR
jgi:signal transduction histidine kinase/CheY-like chemotaxis protein